MASNRERENRVGYPKLTADQINLLIDCLTWELGQRDLGARTQVAEQTVSQLISFYTNRWGLPPALAVRLARIRELAP